MTAVPNYVASPTARDIDPERWVSIGEAAALLSVSRGHLARECANTLEQFGRACKFSVGGRPAQWYVARHHDPRLIPGIVGKKHQTPDLGAYTKRQRQQAMQRIECVKALREARQNRPGNQADWLPRLVAQLRERHGLKISERSLRRWDRDYQHPADLPKLIDTRGGRKASADPRAWDYFRSIFNDPRKPSAKVCHERTQEFAEAEGLRWVSYAQCLKKMPDIIPPQEQMQFRDPAKYRSKFRPYIAQDPEAWEAGRRWIGDHCILDLVCMFNGKQIRPWLTAWMDWRTRKIVGWVLCDKPNSSTILAAFRAGMLDASNLGGPSEIAIDNGKDYDSYALQGMTKRERQKVRREAKGTRPDEDEARGVFGLLGIEVHFSIPHNPNGKSRLERWFGTAHGRFDKTFPTYTGCSVDDKPENLNAILKDAHKVPTFEHVLDRLTEFIAAYNNSVDHQRQDMTGFSPNAALAAWCPEKIVRDAEALNLCMHHWHQPVTVQKNGVFISPRGARIGYGQWEPALGRLKGTGHRVHVAYDPADIRQVIVLDERWRFVCTASMNGRGGATDPISQDHVGQMIAEQRRYKARKRDVAANAHHEYLSREELLRDTAYADRPSEADEQRPMKLVQTPVDEASKVADREQLRKAAGAESYTEPDEDLLEMLSRVPDPTPPDDDDEEDDFDLLGGDHGFKFHHEEDHDGDLLGQLSGNGTADREGGDDAAQ